MTREASPGRDSLARQLGLFGTTMAVMGGIIVAAAFARSIPLPSEKRTNPSFATRVANASRSVSAKLRR